MIWNDLFTGVFSLVMEFSSVVLVGPISFITTLFPDLSLAIEKVTEYFNTILTFVPLALDFLMIPRQALVFLFDFYIIKYSIYLVVRVTKLIITLYNKFKV